MRATQAAKYTGPMARIENKLATIWTGPSIKGFPPVVIGPGGAKAVPEGYVAAWESLKPALFELLKLYVSRGQLKVIRADDPDIKAALLRPEVPQAPANLDGVSEKGALVVIASEDSGDTLRKWQGTERRPELLEAIGKRLRELSPVGNTPPVPPAFNV